MSVHVSLGIVAHLLLHCVAIAISRVSVVPPSVVLFKIFLLVFPGDSGKMPIKLSMCVFGLVFVAIKCKG